MSILKPAAVIGAAVVVAACGAPRGGYSSGYDYDSTPTYHATCQDRAGRILAEWRCEQRYSGSAWAYEPYGTYQQHLRSNPSYYSAGRSCTCGTRTQPKLAGKPVAVQYAGKQTVSVFKDGKQVGSPVKLNQDAKKASTITGESRRDAARRPSFGSYSRTTSKSSSVNRSSFGSPSSTRRR